MQENEHQLHTKTMTTSVRSDDQKRRDMAVAIESWRMLRVARDNEEAKRGYEN